MMIDFSGLKKNTVARSSTFLLSTINVSVPTIDIFPINGILILKLHIVCNYNVCKMPMHYQNLAINAGGSLKCPFMRESLKH